MKNRGFVCRAGRVGCPRMVPVVIVCSFSSSLLQYPKASWHRCLNLKLLLLMINMVVQAIKHVAQHELSRLHTARSSPNRLAMPKPSSKPAP